MTREELNRRLEPILSDALEGRAHESTEDVLKEVLDDYEKFENNSDSGEWKRKYEEIKEKYVRRFLGGAEEEKEEIVEEKKEEEEEKKDGENIKVEDLFEEKKEEEK